MPSICIIIPCYNEFSRFNQKSFCHFVENNPAINFLLVNDGSTDQTEQLLNSLKIKYPKQVGTLSLVKNSGKAEAVRLGVLGAFDSKFDYLGFWDADFSAPLVEVNTMLNIIYNTPKFKVVLGSRIKRMGSTIIRSAIRHYFGRVFSTFSSLIIRLPVYDSQCGAKVFHKEVITPLFSEPFITKWLFDVELLVRYRNHFGLEEALSTIAEYPLNEWREVGGSKLKFTDFVKVPFELLKINRAYNR